MDKEKGDGNTILLTVIGVATLLVALVGATFAYFSTQVNNESNQSMSISTAAPVGLQYLGQKFELTNIIPGTTNTEDQGRFTVTNPGTSTVDQQYDLELVIDENTLNNTDGDGQLLLSITNTTAGTVKKIGDATNVKEITNGLEWDLTDGANVPNKYQFVDDKRIGIGQTDTYQMTLNFVNLDKPQDNNQGKSFRAHIDLTNPVSVK